MWKKRKEKKRRGQKKNEPLIARLWKNYNGGCLIGNDAAFVWRSISPFLYSMAVWIHALAFPFTGTLLRSVINREYSYRGYPCHNAQPRLHRAQNPSAASSCHFLLFIWLNQSRQTLDILLYPYIKVGNEFRLQRGRYPRDSETRR